jgi:uncharacterized protein YwqG
MTLDELAALCEDVGLAHHQRAIAALAAPTAKLQLQPDDDFSPRAKDSFVGGIPFLPSDVEWPVWGERPLAFLAQLQLAELGGLADSIGVPTGGSLCFFYDVDEDGGAWGFDPADKGSARVLYIDPSAIVEPRAYPEALSDVGQFPCARVTFAPIITIPPLECAAIEALGLTPDEEDAYGALIEAMIGEGIVASSWLGGHPEQIQGDMQLDCPLVTGGLYLGDATGYNDPRRAELEQAATDWRLLFQLGSEELAGMMWGDMGMLYFWIRDQDLRQRDFSRTWMFLQCS